jgi:hypothetical protein
MARKTKLYLLHLSFDTARERDAADSQLESLEKLLNQGWDILQSVPLSAAGGITSPTPGAASEPMRFAQWAALIVLQKSDQD